MMVAMENRNVQFSWRMSIQVPDDTLVEIREALFRGQKIQAIKLYREYTETGLAEAKAAMDELEAELRSASPEQFLAAAPGKGGIDSASSVSVRAIAVVVVIFVIVIGIVWRLRGK